VLQFEIYLTLALGSPSLFHPFMTAAKLMGKSNGLGKDLVEDWISDRHPSGNLGCFNGDLHVKLCVDCCVKVLT